ncbi:hypothetical protein ID866_8627 [Astraeus odoratus]|nr:hypothetical protein ID866_8627 [Astraeus odoratus]
MPFPFTFRLSVPGLHNPFLAAAQLQAQSQSQAGSAPKPVGDMLPRRQTPVTSSSSISTRILPSPVHHRRTLVSPPSNSLSPPVPLARKRGWVPSSPELCEATTSATSTSGYLDTPAKYRHMAEREPEIEVEEMIADLPPAKRRRTLAGSIVSTALSAALIGTAVGLTVYRLWRDRGKDAGAITDTDTDADTNEPEKLPPPPPYHRGDWVPVPKPTKQLEAAPATPKGRSSRPRHHLPTSARRTAARQRKAGAARPHAGSPPRSISPPLAHPSLSSLPSTFDFRPPAAMEGVEAEAELDEMDYIGDRLSWLIQEGQKALNREIVVMSDAKEDEVDDGSGNWEEVDDPTLAAGPSVSRRSSTRSLRRPHRPRELALGHPPSYSAQVMTPPSSASPRKRRFDAVSTSVYASPGLMVPSTPRRVGRGASVEAESHSHAPISASFREDESAWESPELRESMARARAQYLQNRRIG